MMPQRVSSHLRRIGYHFGRPVSVGPRSYRIRGYFASSLMPDADHEPHIRKVLQRIFAQRSGTFVDVGANLGQTLLKALALDPDRPYLGFEPQVGCCFFIDQFFKDNGLHHAKVIALALSDENRLVQLFTAGPYDDQASIASATRPDGTTSPMSTLVPARVGDQVFEELGLQEIAAIKIDVEGAELAVLSGLRQTLGTRRPPVLFEVLPNFFGDARTRRSADTCAANRAAAAQIDSLFSALDYEIRQIHPNGDEIPIQAFDLDDAIDYRGSDFIAAPRTE